MWQHYPLSNLTHSFRPAGAANVHTFELTDTGLVWDDGEGGGGGFAYGDVRRVTVAITPSVDGLDHWECVVTGRGRGEKLKLAQFDLEDGHYRNRAATYSPFVRELFARIAEANPEAEFILANPSRFVLTMLALAAVAFAVLAVVVMALDAGTALGYTVIALILAISLMAPSALRAIFALPRQTFDPVNPPPWLFPRAPGPAPVVTLH